MAEHSVRGVSGTVQEASPVLAAAEAHDGVSPVSDQALLAAQQGARELTLFTVDEVSRPVAVGIVGDGELDLVVDPGFRGRRIGSDALRELITRAESVPLRAWAHGVNPAATALLERAGFTPVRTLLRMALDPAKLPDASPGALAPAGFTIRPFDPDSPSDAAAWVRVNAAAFASHPEQGRITEADFALQRAEPWFDADDLLLLQADGADALAGSTWIKTLRTAGTKHPRVATELYAVGVDPAYAGRGLGRALLDATLVRMASHRPDHVTLYVDGENERAVNMYAAAGFDVDSRSRQWLRDVRIGA